MTDYSTLYTKLKSWAESQGWTVKEVTKTILHDYAAMNPAAAKSMGFSMPNNEMWLQSGMLDKDRYTDLSHELIEYRLMKSGMRYWPAHEFSTKHQGNWLITVHKSKPEQIAEQLDLTFDGTQPDTKGYPDLWQFTDRKTGTTTYGNSLASVQYRLSQVHKRYGLTRKALKLMKRKREGSTQSQVSVLR